MKLFLLQPQDVSGGSNKHRSSLSSEIDALGLRYHLRASPVPLVASAPSKHHSAHLAVHPWLHLSQGPSPSPSVHL